MLKNVCVLASVTALFASLTACASAPTKATQTAAAPADAHAVPAAKAEPAAPPETGATSSTPAAEERDPRADGLRKASRPPAELITGPNLVYVFNFKESEVGVAAKQR